MKYPAPVSATMSCHTSSAVPVLKWMALGTFGLGFPNTATKVSFAIDILTPTLS